MKRGREFIGRHYSDDEKDELTDVLREGSIKSGGLIEGETEKTEGEIKLIQTANSFIQAELESLGIERYEPIPLERTHLLSGEVYREKFSDDQENKAFFLSTSDIVVLNKENTDTKARLFSTLLHELVHRASTTRFYADGEDGGIHDARVGYRIRSPWKKKESGKSHSRLVGFNEVMVDFTVHKILLKNRNILETNFGITEEDIQGPIYTYMHYGPILVAVIQKIADDRGISKGEVFDEFERGQFKENILVLKNVEKSFGEGSLEVLSLLGTLKDKEKDKKLQEMIKDYFEEADDSKRRHSASLIKQFARESQDL